jgi:uncharacterized protein (TIGR03382 family)
VNVCRAALYVLAALGVRPAAGGPAPITGGTPSSDTAVVALAYGGTVLECTGTVIAPHAVLTAAHCVTGSTLPDVVVGESLTAATTSRDVLAAFVHPDYDAQSLDHDIAVVLVDPPLDVTPIPFASVLGNVSAGTTIRVVGYGWTVAGDSTPAMRRTGTSQVDAIEPLRIVSHAAPSQACEGDSGGPAFHNDGTGERVIGVVSSGDTQCTEFAKHTRVDVHADFVTDIVARTAPRAGAAGDRCWYPQNCANSACLPAVDEPRWSFCAPRCSDGHCPGDLECMTIDGVARCHHPLPSPGAEGSSCATATDCAGELCLAPADDDRDVCTQRCFSDLPGFDCPSGESCRKAADGGEACFAPPDDGCGCQSSRGSGAMLALFALVFAQLLRGRGKP